MAKAGEALMPISTAIMDLGAAILEDLVPKFEQLSAWLQANLPAAIDTAKGAFEWFQENLTPIATAAAGLLGAFMAFQGLTAIVGAISAMRAAYVALEGATLLAKIQQLALNTVMKANPIILVVSLIAGLVAAFITAYTTSETFRKKVDAVFKAIKTTVVGAVNTVKSVVTGMVSTMGNAFDNVRSKATTVFNAVKNAITTPINAARDAIENAMNRIRSIINNLKLELPRFKLPHFIISGGKIPWGIGGEGTKPRIDVEWYADGGIFSKPTLFATPYGYKGVGEAGPEAVAPIGELMGYVRKAVSEADKGAGGFVSNVTINTGETSEAKIARVVAREQKRQAYDLGVI
jgi:phage-related protein